MTQDRPSRNSYTWKSWESAMKRERSGVMWKVQYKSLLTGKWVDSYHGKFSTELRAKNAAKQMDGYETRVVKAD